MSATAGSSPTKATLTGASRPSCHGHEYPDDLARFKASSWGWLDSCRKRLAGKTASRSSVWDRGLPVILQSNDKLGPDRPSTCATKFLSRVILTGSVILRPNDFWSSVAITDGLKFKNL